MNSLKILPITPSIIQQYYLNKEWGRKAYLSTFFPDQYPSKPNYFTEMGKKLHVKLNYNNTRRFYATIPSEKLDCTLFLEGTPDHINPLKELKTCSYYKFVIEKEKAKVIQAASLQLLGYMILTGEEYGYVVLYCREGVIDEYSVVIHRDDRKFISTVEKFFEDNPDLIDMML